jgi:hypothetical protein
MDDLVGRLLEGSRAAPNAEPVMLGR